MSDNAQYKLPQSDEEYLQVLKKNFNHQSFK